MSSITDPAWESPPVGVDLNQNVTSHVVTVHIVFFSMAVISVALRFISRRLMRTALWWDDWLILLALLVDLVWSSMAVPWMVQHGLGKHVWVTGPDSVYYVAKAAFFQGVSYGVVQLLIRSSVVALLLRLFKLSGIAPKLYVFMGFLLIWFIVYEVMNIFECMPVGSGWERFNFQHPAKAKCTLATRAAGIGTVVPNPIFDAALILIPLPHIWHIQVPRGQRLALMAVFAVGIFVTCVASLRIYFIASLSVTSIDITWSLVNGVIWTMVEINTGIICACLPLLRPILNLMLFRKVDSTGPRTRGDKATALSWCRPARNNNTKLDSEDQEDLFRQNCQNCQADNDIHMQTNIERLPRTPEVEHDSIDIDHGIKVKTDICVGHHKRDVSHT